MDTLIFQYITIAVIFLAASFYLFKVIAKNFITKKHVKGEFGCDRECGH